MTQTQIVIRVTKLRAVHGSISPPVVALWVQIGHVDVNFIIGNTEHDADSQETTSHGYVEDRTIWNCQTLHKSLEITNALIAVHVISQTLYTSHWRSSMH